MVDNIINTKNKRLAKGQRKHIRKMKQAARSDGTVYISQKVRRVPGKSTGE
jgi:hypothetical protein